MADAFEKINRLTGKAISDYGLIRENDHILAAVSGGKDSLLLLYLLKEFKKKSPVRFDFTAVHLDQGSGSKAPSVLEDIFKTWDVPFKIVREDIHSIVQQKIPAGEIQCPLCSRLRRGILYRTARELGCTKIALGHHRDDAVETFLLNAFFSGKLGSMPPVYRIGKGDLQVIRPLINVPENLIRSYVEEQKWPVEICSQCGSSDVLRRGQIKDLLDELSGKFPHMRRSLFGALKNIHAEELLDRSYWSNEDFALPAGSENEN